MTEPRTAAGRALLASLWEIEKAEYGTAAPESDRALIARDILAIEAEAAELAGGLDADRLRTQINALPTWDKRTVPGGFHVNRAAVLELLDRE